VASTRVARRQGSAAAINTVAVRTSGTAANVQGSCGAMPVEQRPHHAAEGQRGADADRRADNRQQQRLAQHQAGHLSRGRAEGEPDRELARPFDNAVVVAWRR